MEKKIVHDKLAEYIADRDHNMAIWDAVQETEPRYTTKATNGRYKFTAINPQSQIKAATRVFGPLGIGWGYEVEHSEVMGDLFLVQVRVWYIDRANTFGPMFGCAKMFNVGTAGKSDDDAPKKAVTDGLTKALSHLGFNSDIYEGRYDDNKYVDELRKKEVDRDKPQPSSPPEEPGKEGKEETTRTTPSGVTSKGITPDQAHLIAGELKALGMADPARKTEIARFVSMIIGHEVQELLGLTKPEARAVLAQLANLVDISKRPEVKADSFRQYLWEVIENGEIVPTIPAKVVEAYNTWYHLPV